MPSCASPDLGVVADTFWRMQCVVRSDHVHAFAAVGPEAARITSDPLPLPPHIPASPAGRVHDLDGQVLLLGVGHEADTMLHLAEVLAGVPYRVTKYCTALQDGRRVQIRYQENDHCCARFALTDSTSVIETDLASELRIRHDPCQFVAFFKPMLDLGIDLGLVLIIVSQSGVNLR